MLQGMNEERSTSMRPRGPARPYVLLAVAVLIVIALAVFGGAPSDREARERGTRDAQQEIQRSYREDLSPAERSRLCARDASAC